jgi:hypothetical protein
VQMFAKIGRWPGRSEAENERVSCITRIVGKVWIGAGRSKAGIPSGLRKQLSTLQEAAASSALICGARDKNGPSLSGGAGRGRGVVPARTGTGIQTRHQPKSFQANRHNFWFRCLEPKPCVHF